MNSGSGKLTSQAKTEALDLLYVVAAHACGILIKVTQVIDHVDFGNPVTREEIDELAKRADCLRDDVLGCKVLYQDTVRSVE